MKIVVLAKQVPDTRNVGPDAMTPEGTVNRAALPAVFNPEDLNALEQALRLKDQFPGSTISVVTMGLPKSAEVIREALYRGADQGYVVTDRCLGGADTLATSYTLSQAIRKIGDFDIILGGRQAIDGDTAQVGPQIAEKLGLTQVTYAEEILSVDPEAHRIVIKRHIDGQIFWLYILWYGLGRAWIEGLRTDSLYIGTTDIRVSQLLAAVSAVAALVVLIINAKKQHRPEDLFVNLKKGEDNG